MTKSVYQMNLRDGAILLRSLSDEDRTAVADLINNRKILDNLRDMIPYPYSEKHAQIFIDQVKNKNPQTTFAISFEEKLCGIIGLDPQQDIYRRSAEIGYWVGEPYWGKNIATRAVKLATTYGLEILDFIRLFAGVFEYNIPSMKVLEKNGYLKEGVFRKSIFKNGTIWDEHRYAITR